MYRYTDRDTINVNIITGLWWDSLDTADYQSEINPVSCIGSNWVATVCFALSVQQRALFFSHRGEQGWRGREGQFFSPQRHTHARLAIASPNQNVRRQLKKVLAHIFSVFTHVLRIRLRLLPERRLRLALQLHTVPGLRTGGSGSRRAGFWGEDSQYAPAGTRMNTDVHRPSLRSPLTVSRQHCLHSWLYRLSWSMGLELPWHRWRCSPHKVSLVWALEGAHLKCRCLSVTTRVRVQVWC